MAEGQEQAHRVVQERHEAEPLVEASRIVVRGIHDQGVHGHGLAGVRDAPDRIGEKQCARSRAPAPTGRPPAGRSERRATDGAAASATTPQAARTDRPTARSACRSRAPHRHRRRCRRTRGRCGAGRPVPPGAREVAVQLGKDRREKAVRSCRLPSGSMTGAAGPVNASRCARRAPPGRRGAARSAGGGSARGRRRSAPRPSRTSAMVSCLSMAFSAVSSALDTMNALTVLPSTEAGMLDPPLGRFAIAAD